jgi:hypothetical protein
VSQGAQIRRVARALHEASTLTAANGARIEQGVEAVGALAARVPDAWRAPPADQASQAALDSVRRAAPAGEAMHSAAGSLGALAEVSDTIATQLEGLEAQEQTLLSAGARLTPDDDPARAARIETQLAETRRRIQQAASSWQNECDQTGARLATHAELVRLAGREPVLTDALAYRGLVHSRTLSRGADVAVGSGLFASAWVGHRMVLVARSGHGALAVSGAVLRGMGHVVTGRWVLPRSPRYSTLVRTLGSASNLLLSPARTGAAATAAWARIGSRYAPQLRALTERMDRASHLVRTGSRLSRVLIGPARVLGVAADMTVLRRGSSYAGARGRIDTGMAGLGLASTGAAVGAFALKGLAAIGIGAGAVVAAPFLAKAAVVTGVAVAAWGLGNLAWDASEGLRRRTRESLTAAGEGLRSAGETLASGATSLVASSGGLVRRVARSVAGG